MIRSALKKALLPAVGTAVVVAAAIALPSRALSIGESLAVAVSCYGYPTCRIYTGEAFGPIHEDQGSPPITNYPVFSSPLGRAAHPAPGNVGNGYVLDAYGGLHPYGSEAGPGQYPYYPGRDLARDFVFLPTGTGGYELDAFGGIHPFSVGANPLPPQPGQYPYYPGNPVAKKITLLSTGLGGYELDAFGGIHPWSVGASPLPAQPAEFGYWNFDIARDIWVDPNATGASASGYVLDGWGGFHPWWTAGAAKPADITDFPYYPNHDIARVLWFQPNATPASSVGYELDGFGGVHPFASAGNTLPPPFTDYPYWPGRDIAKALFGG